MNISFLTPIQINLFQWQYHSNQPITPVIEPEPINNPNTNPHDSTITNTNPEDLEPEIRSNSELDNHNQPPAQNLPEPDLENLPEPDPSPVRLCVQSF